MIDSPTELLGARQLAAMLGISRSEAYQADRDELIPSPVALNSEKRWRTREIIDWIDAGLPRRSDWKWRPTVPAKLDDLIRLRTQQVADLQRELAELRSRLAAGDSHVLLSKGSPSHE